MILTYRISSKKHNDLKLKKSLVKKVKFKILFFILAIFLCISLTAYAWSGKCVGASYGDTISVIHESNSERIRLYGIDCPERGQPFGKRAKQFTSNMVFGKIVGVNPVTKDRYGRIIAWVCVNGGLT